MQNLILQPAGSDDAQAHFRDTIATPVPLDRIAHLLSTEEYQRIQPISLDGAVEIWGVTPGENDANVSSWERTQPGDLVLFTADQRVFYTARLTYRHRNASLAENLWGHDAKGQTWELVYFLEAGVYDDLNVEELALLLGYEPNYVVQRFNVVAEDKARALLENYRSFEQALADIGSRVPQRDEPYNRELERRSHSLRTPNDVDDLLSQLAQELEGKTAPERQRTIREVVRNRRITDLVKQKYDYICQVCGIQGFTKRNGDRYAEVHHREELAASRWDHPDNMICVCPTCHRKLHYGRPEELDFGQHSS